MDSDGHVIGVCQVMNKLNGRVFTEDDVAIIEVNSFEGKTNKKRLDIFLFFRHFQFFVV